MTSLEDELSVILRKAYCDDCSLGACIAHCVPSLARLSYKIEVVRALSKRYHNRIKNNKNTTEKSQLQRSVMSVSSSTSIDIKPKEKASNKVDKNEPKKQEKPGKVPDVNQEKASKKSSEVKISDKLDQKDRKSENLEKKRSEAKTEVTQEELVVKDEKNTKKDAKSAPKTLDHSNSGLSQKESPAGSERAAETQNTLALLAAAEQMATTDKGDYDSFGPPVKPSKKT
ncbi:hypothetical protein TELCIR_11112 [Teladorsagia circumcincta]|uniref:Uncharacterized protein n=1 Tax=Teladorsagia circumcincta TaxID=45464 RepID=A0A2G9UBN0_TELCI|nr:hypothetical protein TELCIR_11112 [Teladorsagia circumcincta]